MTIQFTARHFEARPELQAFAEESVQRLAQVYEGIVSADVVFDQEPHGVGRIVEIGLLVAREKLFAKEKSNDFVASVNACVDKLERQLKKYKDKIQDTRVGLGREGSAGETPAEDFTR
jgi:putative sigma-54 modulation protein